jgi:hypothetical protein
VLSPPNDDFYSACFKSLVIRTSGVLEEKLRIGIFVGLIVPADDTATMSASTDLKLVSLMANVPLTMVLSFGALICGCLVLRSMTVGRWRWTRVITDDSVISRRHAGNDFRSP